MRGKVILSNPREEQINSLEDTDELTFVCV